MADRALSPGERLWLERSRLGETQAQAARRYGTTEKRYRAAELDRDTALAGPRIKPTAAELCRLARRRDGSALRTVAADLGVSHVTLLGWEAVGDARLVEYWKKQ